jgi:hypothetical protein
MTKRRGFTPDFKAKVPLEVLRGDFTIQQIAASAVTLPNFLPIYRRWNT